MKYTKAMRLHLENAKLEGYVPDASDLVTPIAWNAPLWFRKELREVAVRVLASAGYCSCGTKLAPRCPSCSLLHPEAKQAQ